MVWRQQRVGGEMQQKKPPKIPKTNNDNTPPPPKDAQRNVVFPPWFSFPGIFLAEILNREGKG